MYNDLPSPLRPQVLPDDKNYQSRRKRLTPVKCYVIKSKRGMVNWHGISHSDRNMCRVQCLSACVRSEGLTRKLAKAVVILVCLSVCTYQVFQFAQMYMQYPTTVDVEIELLEFSGLPGISVCNRNMLRKNVVCSKEETKALCQNWTSSNKYNQMLFALIDNMTTTELKDYGHQLNNLIHSCSGIIEGDETERDLTPLCEKATWVFNGRFGCFVINDQWNNAEHSNFSNLLSFALLLDLEEGEYPSRLENVAADIYIHSSYVIPTSRISGFQAEVDKRYSLGFTKTTLKLLEPPYATMCRDYRRARKNEATEASCQTNCFLKCEHDNYMNYCKCIPQEIPLLEENVKCNSLYKKDCPASLTKRNRVKCDENCPPDCEVHLYEVSRINDKIAELTASLNESSKSFTYISIDLRSKQQILYSHKPRFTYIELFSYVGGYLSIWLGLSFPLIYGFLETFCIFCCCRVSTSNPRAASKTPMSVPGMKRKTRSQIF